MFYHTLSSSALYELKASTSTLPSSLQKWRKACEPCNEQQHLKHKKEHFKVS